MKIPDEYIYELNDIIKSVDEYDAGGLFLAYKQLLFIEDMFDLYRAYEDNNYDRLLIAKEHVDMLLIRKLAEYEVLKKRVECYESKS